LWITSESGGIFPTRKPSRLTFGPQRIVASVSDRDGKTLYAIGLIQRGELLRYDDRAKRFASYLPGLSAVQLSFSRDGRLLAYVSFPDRSLWRCHSDGSECAQLTSPPMVASWPQWSPDGKQIVFSAQVRGEPFHVYVSPVQGGELQQLTHGERDELNPTWSASGKEIVFGTGLDLQGDSLGIYRLNLLTKEQSTFPGSHHKLFFPQYSPDGKHLAALDQGKLALFSYATQQWTKYEKIEASQPNWSANGDCIYFVGKDQQRSDVYRLRVADQKVERVASLASVRRQSYGGFAWNGTAPDGSLIVFQDASNSEIYSFTWQ
jgi:Tol biopolymer transport system component